MAAEPDKYLGRDVYTYSQEKRHFQKELLQFHQARKTPFSCFPSVSGEQVDLYLLYTLVTNYGGFHKVCDRNLWWKITPELFNFPAACANTELALKQFYMRYLYLYERVYVHGDDPDHPDEDDSGPRGTKPGRILVHQVQMKYNYLQHNVRRHDRVSHGLSIDLAKSNEYERLEKSLLSGLPNEVDFAINVCCLLSMENHNSIKLLTHRRLIDLLLAHVGLFSDNSTLQQLYHNEWFPKTGRNFTKFWYEAVEHGELDYGSTLIDMISCSEHRLRDQNFYLSKDKPLCGSGVLHLGRDNSKDSVLHRIHQVSNIIRNLSFDTANGKALAESSLVFNFAMLCCHTSLPELKRTGLDILSSISKVYILPAIHESSTQLIIRCLHRWMHSQDKLELVSALLVIAALAQVEQNEDSLVESISQDVYCQIVSLARIYDLQLIVAAIDALYYLSEIGEATCEAISLVKHCIDFLANLVTVETQSFGESALGGIIVRDHGIPQHQIPQQGHLHRPIGTMMGPPATPFSIRPAQVRPAMVLGQSPAQPGSRPPTPTQIGHGPHMMPSQRQPTPYRPQTPKSGLSPSQRTILPATPQNLATMSPEQVATNWLRANYEPYPGALVFTAKVHQEYVMWLHRRGGPSAVPVTAGLFVGCVKKVFPYSELVANGQESQISGVRWKPPQTLPSGGASGTMPSHMRPVLTAQQPPAYPGHHMMTPDRIGIGSPTNGIPPRISSPSSNTASNDMLRSMLLSEGPSRQRSDSGASSSLSSGCPARSSRGGKRGKGSRSNSPRTKSSGDSPLPPMSPVGAMELQVCGSAEKVESFVNGASLARIRRVENPQSSVSASQSYQSLTSTNKISTSDLSDNPDGKCNGDTAVPKLDFKTRDAAGGAGDCVKRKEEDNDSAMDTSEPDPLSHDSTKSHNSKENGVTTPSDTLSSPPFCNGNVSDTDSLLAEPTKLVNGVGKKTKSGGDIEKPFLATKNGCINGLEKMIASISSDKPKSNAHKQLPDHRRHHSGDSLASQSSTSTQLSISQNSQSSDQKQDLIEQPANHLPVQTASTNQQLAHLPSTNQQSVQLPASTNQLPAQTLANQQSDKASVINHIPTVVESEVSRGTPPPNKLRLLDRPPPQSSNISVSVADGQVAPPSPVPSPRPSSRSSRKRRKSTASTDSRHSNPDAVGGGPHKCLWEGCGSGFTSCSLLRKHASTTHTATSGPCLWAGCDRVERKRWALVSHVNERHTSEPSLTIALQNREKGILPAAHIPNQQTVSYTPQAAKMAILRNYPKPPYPDFQDIREGPVTKHIRFTAALILRNICRYSPTGRTLLKKHEGNLAAIAGSTMEASAAVLNILSEIQQAQCL